MTDTPSTPSTPSSPDPDRAADAEAIDRLAAADPVAPGTLPSSADPSALAMLDRILDHDRAGSAAGSPVPSPVGSTTGSATGSAEYPRVEPALAVVGGAEGRPKRGLFDRGRVLMVSAAAAVALLVGSVMVLAPDSTPSALAQVQSAATAAADAESGEIITLFRADGEGSGESGSVEGRFEAQYHRSDVQFSLDLSDLNVPGGPGVEGTNGLEDAFGALVSDVRIVDGVLYIQPGGQWLAVDTEGFLGQFVNQYSDPRVVLDQVRELTEATEVGPTVVDGVEVTHFRSTIDLGEETLSDSGWVGFDGADVGAEGEVTVDLYVDGDDALRRLELRGDVAEPADGAEGDLDRGTFEVITTFTELAADVTIEAPEGAVDFDPAAILGSEGLFEELEG